jgi:RNA polymerase sigma factor (sigma-70 family)
VALDVESLYRRYGPQVLRRCRFLLREEAQAVDAMQDVFVELLKYQDRLRSVAPSSLLHQIATHVCLNKLRGSRRRPEDPEDERVLQIAASEDVEARTFAQRALDTVFGRVPASSRDIAVLHFVDGMTLEQTAAEVGMSVSGVRKRLRGLAEVLKGLEVGE